MAQTGGGPTILVVDDERLSQVMLTDMLEAGGMQCLTASNGVEALQVCAGTRPDLVLLDITMPQMDGIETCRRLRANPETAAIPVIALTTHDDPPTVFAMMEAGAFLYLTKPVSPERLLSAVRLGLHIAAP